VAQIFLSYSRTDLDAARVIAGSLATRGHHVWWDKNISGGAKFAAEIEQALNAADVVMVLWSAASVASPWVLDEAAEGRDTGRLLPVALDNCKPPLGFRQYQTIAVPGAPPDAAIDEIHNAIAARSAAEPSAAVDKPSIDPNGVEAHCARALQLEEQGRFDEAQREIDSALGVEPDSVIANREAARLLYLQGRARDAISFAEKAVAAAKSEHESAALLISCYRATNNDAGMKRAAELALSRAEHLIAGGSATGTEFASAAKGLAALGHRDRARKWVRKARNMDPGNLPMHYDLAATLAAFLDDHDAAIDVLEPFVERASNRAQLQLIEADPDWDSLRDSRDFKSLAARARKRVEALEATAAPSPGIEIG
jgi:tetratricopeptide (TPR) repeat protein